jgi:hypothetical protein
VKRKSRRLRVTVVEAVVRIDLNQIAMMHCQHCGEGWEDYEAMLASQVILIAPDQVWHQACFEQVHGKE